MSKKGTTKFSEWLANLQQESWQLELIISGFTIFLLLGAYEPLLKLIDQIELLATIDNFYKILIVPYGILRSAWYILVFNLLLHVALRGLWISTIGLRYISGDIDFDDLDFSPPFDKHLRKRIVSFDHYIERLEKICSVIFAFTFLLVFILISGGLVLGALVVIGLTIDWVDDYIGNGVVVFAIFLLLFLFFAVVYFIDFITLGWVKKRRWFARIYYPFYRLFSFITLAFIYRPLYYNLIDNQFGRRVGLLVIPYVIILVLVGSLTVHSHGFLPDHRTQQSFDNRHYEDEGELDKLSYKPSIPSKFIEDDFLPLFLTYHPQGDGAIKAMCPDLKPAETGISFGGFFLNSDDDPRSQMNADSALLCNAQIHHIYINDSLLSEVKYRFYDHPTREKIGLLTILDIQYLQRGEHILRVQAKIPRWNVKVGQDSFNIRNIAHIPFWKK